MDKNDIRLNAAAMYLWIEGANEDKLKVTRDYAERWGWIREEPICDKYFRRAHAILTNTYPAEYTPL